MEKSPEITATWVEYYTMCSYYVLHTLSAPVPLILTWRRKMRFREGTAHGHSANKRRSHNVSWL